MTPSHTLQGKKKENKKLIVENQAHHRTQQHVANRRDGQGEENAINEILQTGTGPELRSRDPDASARFQV